MTFIEYDQAGRHVKAVQGPEQRLGLPRPTHQEQTRCETMKKLGASRTARVVPEPQNRLSTILRDAFSDKPKLVTSVMDVLATRRRFSDRRPSFRRSRLDWIGTGENHWPSTGHLRYRTDLVPS
jgi:hypothetical protein